jgi:prepilin-type N-terminal cleavage/methylation domain-containing protein
MQLHQFQFHLLSIAIRQRQFSQKRQNQLLNQQPTEQGFSLMEILVAIVIIAAVLAIAAPPMMMAVAVRVQNRNVEQASQIAQQEVERVKFLVAKGNPTNTGLPPSNGDNSPDEVNDFDSPSSYSNCVPPAPCLATDPRRAMITQDGKFLVQTFRNEGEKFQSGTEIVTFRMGVRVYSIEAKKQIDNGETLSNKPGKLLLSTGLGSQSVYPIAVLYTDISRSDTTGSLTRYREQLKKKTY